MPQEPTAEEKLAGLEERLAALESRGNGKDRWDKFQIRAALTERRERLVEDLHAADEGARQHAAQALKAGFRRDPELAQQIATAAEKHPEDEAGLVRSAEVLKAVPADQIGVDPDAVKRLAKVAEQHHDDKARALFQQIKLRVPPDPNPPTAERHE